MSPRRTRDESRRPAAGALWLLAVLAVLAAGGLVWAGSALSPTAAQAATSKKAAKKVKKSTPASLTAAVKATNVTATTAKITATGTVKLPSSLKNTAKNRKKVTVRLQLSDAAKKTETRYGSLTKRRGYTITRSGTTLRGTLTAKLQVRVSGKASGKAVTKTVAVKVAGGSGTGTTPGATTPGTTPGATNPVPADAQKLVGLFRLDPGVRDQTTGKHSGSYFRMGYRAGGDPSEPFQWILNATSRSSDPSYTLLRPGSDGGLATGRYQQPATPLYDDSGVLTQNIAQRELFFGQYFTVFTTDRRLEAGGESFVFPGGAAVPGGAPVPEIFYKDGKLYGQATAFVANWAQTGIFAQGSPKFDGSLPGDTKPVEGTYDPATRRYTIHWSSEIVSGPFGGKTGFWYLSGTFEPAP
ncbi:hypothetical protein AB0L40_06865 [Patulibacter sp. NPDC049589]|uniref:hypothetical protein n=1 Tax=Patulibacter sp. NPDC049589 TaxID=3154731 RepID=UPI0034306E23